MKNTAQEASGIAAKWLTRVAASNSTSTDRTKARLAVADMAAGPERIQVSF